VLNALAGGVGVAIFGWTLLRIVAGRRQAMLSAAVLTVALAVSFGYWYHSTDVEDQILSNTLVAVAFAAIVFAWPAGGEPAGSRTWVDALAALALALAILVHATHVLFLPAAAYALWLRHRRWREVFRVLGVALAVVGLVYLLVGSLRFGFRTPIDYWRWAFASQAQGVWGQPGPRNLWLATQTLADAVLHSPEPIQPSRLLAGGAPAGVWLAVARLAFFWLGALAVGIALVRRAGDARQRRWLVLCLLWATPYALFNLYWAPEDIQFWVIVLPPGLIALGLAYTAYAQAGGRRAEVAHLLACVLTGLLLAVNLGATILPRADAAANPSLAKLACAVALTTPRDLVVSLGWDWASGYVSTFSDRRVFSLVDVHLSTAGGDKARTRSLWEQAVRETQAAGGQVYVFRLYDLGGEDRDWLRRTTGLTPEDFEMPRAPAGRCGEERVWMIRGV
jgi:hypothetical protein